MSRKLRFTEGAPEAPIDPKHDPATTRRHKTVNRCSFIARPMFVISLRRHEEKRSCLQSDKNVPPHKYWPEFCICRICQHWRRPCALCFLLYRRGQNSTDMADRTANVSESFPSAIVDHQNFVDWANRSGHVSYLWTHAPGHLPSPDFGGSDGGTPARFLDPTWVWGNCIERALR